MNRYYNIIAVDRKESVLVHFLHGFMRKERRKVSQGYRTVSTAGASEVEERKSRFLGLAVHIESEEEARMFLEQIRKKHYDARHNCWAYVLGDDGSNERASDDGEPSGTAGRPILETIRHAELTYTMVVVTRYFGGTLLGTGGLVHAYTQAAADALDDAGKAEYKETARILVTADYSDAGKLQYLFSGSNAKVVSSEYAEKVRLELLCDKAAAAGIEKQITEMTAARAETVLFDAGFQMI